MKPGQTDERNPADWFAFAQERWRAARLLGRDDEFFATATEILQEAVERYLKGFLIAHDWKLVKTHDLDRLVAEAQKFEAEFGNFRGMAAHLTESFFAQHYPGGDLDLVARDFKDLLAQSAKLIELIHRKLPQFFQSDPPGDRPAWT